MAFKKTTTTTLSINSPESMLHDIRSKKIEGPLARQADVWREYTDKALNESDVAIRLPTGSGKTLVGIVLGEWRRRKFGERVLYLCPTRQLVNQVAHQAREIYGIDVAEFVGSKQDYSPESTGAYRRNEKIAISTYSSLFNTSPYFESPDIIILDDAHAAENYIASMWSLEIELSENPDVFAPLIGIFEQFAPNVDLSRAKRAIDVDSLGWVEKIPSQLFYNSIDALKAVLDEKAQESNLRFTWALLRDHLSACHCYISATQILIRPLIPPTFTHAPFEKAKQRIYMSATLGAGGDLERVTGRSFIYRLSPDSITDEQGIGRRFFIFPDVAFSFQEVEGLISDALGKFGRGIFITPNKRMANERIEKIESLGGYTIFQAAEIENSKVAFVTSTNAVAVIANRYDGMDFPHNECRLLVLEGLPKAANSQEKFLLSKMGCTTLFNDRIQTRIVQAIGRCTRANSDYAAVVVTGTEWVDYLLTNDYAKFLHPELQAELEFGDIQSSNTMNDILENLDAFKAQDEAWLEANEEIINIRDTKTKVILPETNDLQKSVVHEIDYVKSMWRQDYRAALERCREVLANISHANLKGYRALWNYLAGSCVTIGAGEGQFSDSETGKEYYSQAMMATMAVSWLANLAKSVNLTHLEGLNDNLSVSRMVESIEKNLLSLGVKNNKKFNKEVADIISNISQKDARFFERGQLELGRFLGLICGKSRASGAPDPWWIVSDEYCVVFEDHTDADNPVLSVEKARQVCCHDNWVKENVDEFRPSMQVIKVLISPVNKVAIGGKEHLNDVYFIRPEEFRQWASDAIAFVRGIRESLLGEGDLVWRAQAISEIVAKGFSPADIVKYLKAKKATDVLST